MDSARFIIFLSLLLILLLLDIYFLKSWQRYIKSRGWNRLLYIIPWCIGLLMLLSYAYTYILRLSDVVPTTFQKSVYVISSLWYIPKILIVPIIFIKDLIKYISKKFTGINKKNNNEGSSKTSDSAYTKPIPKPLVNTAGRRQFIQHAGWVMAAVPFGMVGKGLASTTYDFKTYKIEIPLLKLTRHLDGLTIAQISDIHAGSFFTPQPILDAIDIVNSLKPDVIIITGDFVNFHPDELKESYKFFKKLKSDLGVFGCLGNHDHYMSESDHKRLNQMLAESNIKMLVNNNLTLKINDSLIQIAGCDNSSYGHNYADWQKTMKCLLAEEPTILLCHDPSNWDSSILGKLPVDLTLSGHTHGGQIGINFLGEIIAPARIVLKRWAGIYKEGNQLLYINRGIGTVGPPVRVSVPPEITLITLRSTAYVTL